VELDNTLENLLATSSHADNGQEPLQPKFVNNSSKRCFAFFLTIFLDHHDRFSNNFRQQLTPYFQLRYLNLLMIIGYDKFRRTPFVQLFKHVYMSVKKS